MPAPVPAAGERPHHRRDRRAGHDRRGGRRFRARARPARPAVRDDPANDRLRMRRSPMRGVGRARESKVRDGARARVGQRRREARRTLDRIDVVSRIAPSPPAVHSVWHLGAAPAAATDAWALIGQDGGQSIDLGDDVLFVFADTLLAGASAWRNGLPASRWPIRRDQGRFLANCCARAGRGRLTTELGRLRYALGIDGWPKEILEATAVERLTRTRFWPEHGIAIDGRVYLYYLGIEHFEPNTTWGFRNLGTGLAVLDAVSGNAVRLRWDGDWRLWPAGPADVHAGVQVVRDGDHVYVFASTRDGCDITARLG